jgi:uncharacterized protein
MIPGALVELSPFDYTGPLPPELVRGRDELLVDLTERVTSRSPTALLGPRRYGKTSVLQRLAADLTESAVIAIDLMPAQTSNDVARALTAALLDTDADVARDATEVSATLGFNLVGLRGQVTSTRPADRPDPAAAYANLVDTLVRTAVRRPTVVIFDEFQQIATVPNGTAVLRAALQHHYKDIGLLFAGSEPSAMRNIFSNHSQPFLHQAQIVEIGPLDLPATQHIVNDGFTTTGRTPGAVASLIHQFTHGHPLRTMQAAHAAWLHTTDAPADTTWGAALTTIRKSARPEVSAVYEQLPHTHQKTLRVIAHRRSALGVAGELVNLSKGSAQGARRSLLDHGHLVDVDGSLYVTDPFLADWLVETRPL